jgi:hypothetical protein
MKQMKKESIIGIVIGLAILTVYVFNSSIAILIICLVFQVFILLSLYSQYKTFQRFRNAPLVEGALMDFFEIDKSLDKEDNFVGTWRFIVPETNEQVEIKRSFYSINKPSIGKKITISINLDNPEESIPKESTTFWNFKSVFFISLFILLIVVNIVYIRMIF